MKDIGEGTIRQIDWQELAPVVLLFRVFPTAIRFRVLFFSMFGLLLSLIAGYMINEISSKSALSARVDASEENELIGLDPITPNIYKEPVYIEPLVLLTKENPVSFRTQPLASTWNLAKGSVLLPWDFFSTAGIRAFSISSSSWADRGIALGWLVALLFIWSLFGGMICRTIGVRLTIDQSESFGDLMRFLKERGMGYLSGVLLLTIAILFLLGLVKLTGQIYSVPFLNYAMALFFPITLVLSYSVMLLAVGLLFGWPILFAAVGVEGADGFDAISRTFSYLFQRPLHFLFYWAVSGLLGVIGFVFVSIFMDGTVALAVQWGGFPVSDAVGPFTALAGTTATQPGGFPDQLVLCWCLMAQLMKLAFCFAWFWTTGVAIYLLLRRSVDGTPLCDVFRMGAAAKPPRKLPEIN